MRDLIKANAALLFAAISAFILMGAGQSLYGPTLPAFSRAFGMDVSVVGLLVSSHWIGCAVGVGAMYLRPTQITPRHVIAAMLAGALLLALGLNFAIILLGGVLFGAGYGAATVVFNPRVLAAFGPRGPAMVSLINACFGIGAIAAPLVFVALDSDPRPTFLLCAGISAVVWVFSGAAGKAQATNVEPVATPFRPHWPILIFHGLAIALEACLIGLGPTALIRAGIAEVRAAELLSVFFIGFLLARILLTLIAHRIDAFTIATLSLLGCGVAALVGAMGWASIAFVPMGFCAGMFFPSIYVVASAAMGVHPRTAVTIIAAGMVGGIVAPLILSPLLPHLGDHGFFWLVAIVCGGMVAAAGLRRAQLMAPKAPAPLR